jgi:tetratricopeptide (TPR) repeat protein
LIALASAVPCLADDPATKDAPKPVPRTRRSVEDVPSMFVPLHPRTSEERDRLEAVRLFAAAEALRDRQKLREALELLEKAQKLDPTSTAILRRLSRTNLALGKTDEAIAVAKKIVEIEPGDTVTLELLINHYLERKGDPVAVEAILKKLAANPKLEKASPGYDVIQRTLGDLYADLLNKPELAADAYSRLMEALDEKAANGLSMRDKLRVLDGDEASAYLRFGQVFLTAKRYSQAVHAFRRGLIYRPDDPILPRVLADALAKDGKPDQALNVLDGLIKRQPAGSEPYELLSEILVSTGRPKEILPRLEAAAHADSKNLRLQFLLAERYRIEGQNDKADALLRDLVRDQPEPQVYAALAQSLLREKKADELVRVLDQIGRKPGGFESVRDTIAALVEDPAMAGRVIDAGLALQAADPPKLSAETRKLLTFVASRTKQVDKLIALDRAALAAAPSAQAAQELAINLLRFRKYDESVAAFEQLLAKYPAEKNATNVMLLSRAMYFSGKIDASLTPAREAVALDPNDHESLQWLGVVLSQTNHDDEAIALYQDILKRFGSDEDMVKIARSGLSTCFVNKGDFAKGEAELEILFQKYPDDPGINNDLGYLYADQGKNLEKAEEMIRKALEKARENAPDDASDDLAQPSAYLDSLGWVLFKRGKAKEALEPLEKAASKSETLDYTICEHLGDVLFSLQDYARARDFWTKAEGFASKSATGGKRLPEIRKKLAELEKLGPAPKPPTNDGP